MWLRKSGIVNNMLFKSLMMMLRMRIGVRKKIFFINFEKILDVSEGLVMKILRFFKFIFYIYINVIFFFSFYCRYLGFIFSYYF